MVGPCIDDNVASEFVSGSLPRAAVTRVEGHLATCRDCRELVAALAGDDPELAGDSNVVTAPRARGSETSATDSPDGRAPMRPWSVGDRVGRYVVLSALGQGGMGVVFSAYDPQLDRKVALKLLRTNSGINSKEARARLRREAQAIAQLSHPNVVNVYDVGATDDGDVYIAMEFVEGDTLTRWLRNFARTPREIVEVFLQAARGLYAAHAVGLLHRDFKPDNVLVGRDGRVRVTDFGLARSVLGPDEQPKPRTAQATHLHVELTATGTVLGTPRYMPPEQLLGPDIDARSDQFSFCVALYEALYGQHPLPGETAIAMVDKNERAYPAPENKGVPAAVGRAVTRGLEKDRAKRHASMAALITELAPRHERGPARFAAIAVATVAVAGAAAATVYLSRGDAPKPVAPATSDGEQRALEKLAKVEKERRDLLEKLTKIQTENTHVIEDLRAKLEEKNAQVDQLVLEVTELKKKPAAAPAAPRQDQRVIAALEASEFEGCFAEWRERQLEPRNPDITVRLTVMPDGHTHSATGDYTESPSLNLCVESAVTRLSYPTGPEALEIATRIRYNYGDGAISITASVVGRHAPTASIDLGN